MGEVEHGPIAIAWPIDRPVAVIRRATEGLSLPGDVAERHVGSAGLRQIEVAFARIARTEIGTELRIRLAVRSVRPFRESGQAEKGEVGGSRKDVEGKAQPYLAVERCHSRGQQKPGREPDLELPREALEGAHGAECSVKSAGFSAFANAHKRRAPARGLPRLVRITQNALPPRRNTTGRIQNALDPWQFCDAFLSISLLTTRIWGVRLTPRG